MDTFGIEIGTEVCSREIRGRGSENNDYSVGKVKILFIKTKTIISIS